ncbi:NAD(P)/FAD-dependent oxidoreductase [Pedobacter jejuensis]|uniref:FAD-binding oxidoreductase n=1 Tax=Pedobacter jejuensis TaxID=1268550 RepID=A0A3N0BPC5_9SPHI|nr:FAD-binding oxidoreductase [Pedobacter jejuensis]RNL50649.1 FAD-binding oxidoreductase [Pedobacter jejuensis]
MSSNLSYWEKSTFFNFDVVVIGSGIVGLNAAIHLKKALPLLKILVLERGFLPSGASTKNAGFACFGSISELIEQEGICGTDGLMLLIEKRWKGLLKLRALLGDEKLDYKQYGGFELFTNDDDALTEQCVSKIEHYNQLISPIVGSQAFCIANNKIDSFGFKNVKNLIYNQYEAQIDTGKMMFNLIQLAQSLQIFILNNCEVAEIISDDNQEIIITNQGRFYCKRVIVTTNAFVKSLLPGLDVEPGRGQVLITKPIRNLKIEGTFHYDKGFYYFRNINDRVLLGGGRNLDFKTEETTAFGQTAVVQKALETLLRQTILPDTHFEIDERWSGIMAFGKYLEPIITEAKPNVFCAARCNGMGIAMGSQTGTDAAELVMKSL